MVHDHADLAATGRLIHIPVPVGKESTIRGNWRRYHRTSKPLISHKIPLCHELKILLQNTIHRKRGLEVLPVSRITHFLIWTSQSIIWHLPQTLCREEYITIGCLQSNYEKKQLAVPVWTILLLSCFLITGFVFPFFEIDALRRGMI